MAHLAEAANMAVDLHFIGRVGEDEIRVRIVKQPAEGKALLRITTDQPMLAELPDVSVLTAGPTASGT